MATQKPISTISYNTEGFLREKLDSWYNAHIIQSYQYILHKGEDGDKDHIHLRIEPNKRLDPMELSSELKEYVRGNSKPLCCRTWRPSKEEDWLLYAIHDRDYLALKYSSDKGEKISYDWRDIRVPADYDIETAIIRARSILNHTPSSLANRLESGESPSSLVFQGENPYLVMSVYKCLATDSAPSALSRDFERLRDTYYALLQAIEDFGLVVNYDENGVPALSYPPADDISF